MLLLLAKSIRAYTQPPLPPSKHTHAEIKEKKGNDTFSERGPASTAAKRTAWTPIPLKLLLINVTIFKNPHFNTTQKKNFYAPYHDRLYREFIKCSTDHKLEVVLRLTAVNVPQVVPDVWLGRSLGEQATLHDHYMTELSSDYAWLIVVDIAPVQGWLCISLEILRWYWWTQPQKLQS